MNFSKFLLIDAALAISAIPLLYLIDGKINTSHFLRSFNKEKIVKNTAVKFPDKEKLIQLEKIAENQGSGIDFDSLIGNWTFISVWGKDFCKEDTIFSSLLRLFSAKIKFKDFSTRYTKKYHVMSSIQFGLLTIEFSGSGCLKGKQPILVFFLNQIELKSGSKTLFSRTLREADEKQNSFFNLIAIEENNKWLTARGRGGAVVIWLKD